MGSPPVLLASLSLQGLSRPLKGVRVPLHQNTYTNQNPLLLGSQVPNMESYIDFLGTLQQRVLVWVRHNHQERLGVLLVPRRVIYRISLRCP